ncbi:MAG: hypothetical protein ACFB2Z_04095 [Maricaulaceae bacterium]
MIVGNMATFPKRIDVLEETVRALSGQLDKLNVVLNEFSEPPRFFKRYANVEPIVPDRDYKDVGKFLPDISGAEFVVLVDDDIQYPPNYVSVLREQYERLKKRMPRAFVLGVHGTTYADIFTGGQKARNVYVFWRALNEPKLVNQLGTGTCFLPASLQPPLTFMDASQRYVDVRFARYQFEHDVDLVCAQREDGWMRDAPGERETIFQDFTRVWPAHVTREVQTFGGYGRLNLDAVTALRPFS